MYYAILKIANAQPCEAETTIIKIYLINGVKGVLGRYFIVPVCACAILALKWVELRYIEVYFR